MFDRGRFAPTRAAETYALRLGRHAVRREHHEDRDIRHDDNLMASNGRGRAQLGLFPMVTTDPEIEDDADRALDDDDGDDFPEEYSISSYGADYPVDGLVQWLEKARGIKIAGFQRGYVWTQKQASQHSSRQIGRNRADSGGAVFRPGEDRTRVRGRAGPRVSISRPSP
jgi:hypothetical protein